MRLVSNEINTDGVVLANYVNFKEWPAMKQTGLRHIAVDTNTQSPRSCKIGSKIVANQDCHQNMICHSFQI